MRVNNVVMIGIALVCAIAAALLTRAWLVSQSAQAPKATETAAKPSVSIVVAGRDLKYGETLKADSVKLVARPAEDVPKGAFVSVESLLGAAGSRKVRVDMIQGEAVLDGKLFGGAADKSIIGRLSPNMVAATVRVNDVAGVAGFVQPDDRVDVLFTSSDQFGNETAPKSSASISVLMRQMRVLAVDQVTQRNDQPTPAKVVTLEASVEQAQKLALAGKLGELSLVLNGVAEKGGSETTGTISYDDLINAENTAKRKNGKAGADGPTVKITRGTDGKDYQVTPEKSKRDEGWQTELLSHQGSITAPGR